jgi:cation transport ATPase
VQAEERAKQQAAHSEAQQQQQQQQQQQSKKQKQKQKQAEAVSQQQQQQQQQLQQEALAEQQKVWIAVAIRWCHFVFMVQSGLSSPQGLGPLLCNMPFPLPFRTPYLQHSNFTNCQLGPLITCSMSILQTAI